MHIFFNCLAVPWCACECVCVQYCLAYLDFDFLCYPLAACKASGAENLEASFKLGNEAFLVMSTSVCSDTKGP